MKGRGGALEEKTSILVSKTENPSSKGSANNYTEKKDGPFVKVPPEGGVFGKSRGIALLSQWTNAPIRETKRREVLKNRRKSQLSRGHILDFSRGIEGKGKFKRTSNFGFYIPGSKLFST